MAANILSLEQSPMQRLMGRLMSATAFVSPSLSSPFDSFGVAAARPIGARAKTLENGFNLRDVRDRIRDFLDGSFSPKSVVELVEYLADRLMHLELRFFDGRAVNYLVDRANRKAVPASIVDARLSRAGIARAFGSTADQQLQARKGDALTPEQVDARSLRARIAGRLASTGGSMFMNWDDAAFTSPAYFRNREMTAQGDELWIGAEYARASDDPEENLRIVARAAEEDVKLVLPAETMGSAKEGRLVPGMPILIRKGAVRTKLIDPALSFANLTKTFGSPFEHFRAAAKRSAPRINVADLVNPGKVVDISAFRRAKKSVAPAAGALLKVPGALTIDVLARCVVKHQLDEHEKETISFVDRETGREYPVEAGLGSMGVYHKEDAFGLPAGFLKVGADGGFVHLDSREREHNAYGPAIVPSSASGKAPVFAIEGERVDPRTFALRTSGDGPSIDDFPRPAKRASAASLPSRRDENVIDRRPEMAQDDEPTFRRTL